MMLTLLSNLACRKVTFELFGLTQSRGNKPAHKGSDLLACFSDCSTLLLSYHPTSWLAVQLVGVTLKWRTAAFVPNMMLSRALTSV